jgi:Fur family peroxide stress response transcriptional regulator
MTPVKNPTITNIKEYLLKNDVHPSFHRLKIMEYLLKNHTHPSVDRIYSDISEEIPTLSKTTVYNTLNLFSDKNIVTVLTIDENESRYDYNIENHVHFKCTACNAIMDLELENPLFQTGDIQGNDISECHIYLRGTCKSCKQG